MRTSYRYSLLVNSINRHIHTGILCTLYKDWGRFGAGLLRYKNLHDMFRCPQALYFGYAPYWVWVQGGGESGECRG